MRRYVFSINLNNKSTSSPDVLLFIGKSIMNGCTLICWVTYGESSDGTMFLRPQLSHSVCVSDPGDLGAKPSSPNGTPVITSMIFNEIECDVSQTVLLHKVIWVYMCMGCTTRNYSSVNLRWSPGICIFNNLQVVLLQLVQASHFEMNTSSSQTSYHNCSSRCLGERVSPSLWDFQWHLDTPLLPEAQISSHNHNSRLPVYLYPTPLEAIFVFCHPLLETIITLQEKPLSWHMTFRDINGPILTLAVNHLI